MAAKKGRMADKYKFMPGLALNRRFYYEVVGPLLEKHFPKLKHSAALIGNGSDVQGWDDASSMDHNWGPKLRLFLPENNFKRTSAAVNRMLRKDLPRQFLGYPTSYTPLSNGYIKQRLIPTTKGPINHLIKFYTIRSFFEHYLGFNPKKRITVIDWLTFPEQALLEITGGEVFHDDVGLKKMRAKFAYYPHDVWLYILRIQWGRIANELSYHARAGKSQDELGAYILAARMVRRIIKMAFLLEKRYAPYAKWLGTAFNRLSSAPKLKPILLNVLRSKNWRARQRNLALAWQILAQMQNNLDLFKPLSTELSDFHGRGYNVVDIEPFLKEIERHIKNKKLRHMKFLVGSVDQFIDHARINQENYFHRELKKVLR
jgi:hypothetical protein